jgi:AhpD family alkylhydroperoxidase
MTQHNTRLPLITDADARAHSATANSVRQRRGGGLITLDRALLYSAPMIEGWNVYLGALRERCKLNGKLRELAIVRVALLTRAKYEYDQHAPVALKCGASQAQIDALPAWQLSSDFDPVEKAVLAYTDAMTVQVQVPDAVFAAVKKALNDDQCLVELTATIAAYNMVARFLEAMHISTELTTQGALP